MKTQRAPKRFFCYVQQANKIWCTRTFRSLVQQLLQPSPQPPLVEVLYDRQQQPYAAEPNNARNLAFFLKAPHLHSRKWGDNTIFAQLGLCGNWWAEVSTTHSQRYRKCCQRNAPTTVRVDTPLAMLFNILDRSFYWTSSCISLRKTSTSNDISEIFFHKWSSHIDAKLPSLHSRVRIFAII